MKIMADLIELYLAKRGMKKADLAKRLGMAPCGVSALINRARAGREMRADLVHKLTRALQVNPEDLALDFAKPAAHHATAVDAASPAESSAADR